MPRGRRVRRVVRRIDPLSVLKVSVFFYLSMVVVLLVGTVILWSLAQGTGAIGKVEKFMQDLGFTDFTFRGGELFKVCVFGGLVLTIAGTVFTTIMAFLYNLISDLVGGVEFQVIEEESVYSPTQTGAVSAGGRPAPDRGRRRRDRGRAKGRQPQPPPPSRQAPPPGYQPQPAQPQQAPVGRRTVV